MDLAITTKTGFLSHHLFINTAALPPVASLANKI